MQITTKFNIGDTVWTVKDNKAYVFRIQNKRELDGKQQYQEHTLNIWTRHDESSLVGSREELINLL